MCDFLNELDNVTYAEIVSDIVNGKKTLLHVVQSLEPVFTGSDLNKYKQGLEVLAHIVKLLPKDFLTAKELEYIVHFFCTQIKQHHTFISAALEGIIGVIQNSHLSRECLFDVTSTLFGSVVWQTQSVSDRRILYQILQYMIFNCLEDCKNNSSEFLFNVISSVDGERDPRNLLLIFSFIPKLFSSLPLGPLAEDAFEVVSCYFPIDFYSPNSDSAAVTRDDLVSALIPCLLLPDFATFCIALIQEKLESTLKSAKLDAFGLLAEGCSVWPSTSLAPHCEALWQAVKQEALPPRDTQVAGCASVALKALVKAAPEPALSSLLLSVINSCKMFLSDVQLSMFEPSFHLLLTSMEASESSCNIVYQKLLPTLEALLQGTKDTISKSLVLKKLKAFIKVCHHNNIVFNSGAVWTGLQNELVASCVEEVSEEIREAAFNVISLIPQFLVEESRLRLYPAMLNIIVSQQSGVLRVSCLKCLQQCAILYSNEVQSNVIVSLEIAEGETIEFQQNKFSAVCSLAVVEQFQEVLKQQLVNMSAQSSSCIIVLVPCLRNFLEDEEVQKNEYLIQFLFTHSPVLDTLIRLNLDNENHLHDSAIIIRTLVRLQESSEQTAMVQDLTRELLQRPKSVAQMVLLEALLSPLWPDINILTIDEINSIVIPAAFNSLEKPSQMAALRLISTFINKSKDDHLLELVHTCFHNSPVDQRTTAYIYITKALIIRGHPLLEQWLNKLLEMLDNKDLGDMVADGMKLIVEDSESFLSIKDHCLIKILYRQRLFNLVLPWLVQSRREVYHLKVLGYLLQSVPHTVYVQHIKQIIPLLVKSLDMDSEQLLVTTLHSLASLVAVDHFSLQDQVDTFIPRFLQLARHYPFMKVRIEALKCLSNSLTFSPILLLPYKQQVVSELMYCLDDKKRLVRKSAAHTRSKWFLLGTQTPDS